MGKIIPVWYGEVDGRGQIVYDRAPELRQYLAKIATHQNRGVQVVIKKRKRQRSKNQNDYYWAVIVDMVAEAMGITPKQANEFLKSEFLTVGIERNGKRWEVTRSSSDLSTVEFEEYCQNCRMWASAELGIYIPEPNEAEWN